ncbi:MAG: GNAT family N-acetyltransferase [Polaromonas sp.]|nr:GNAT family N-acetyltransferase [Polaromonas sp.]
MPSSTTIAIRDFRPGDESALRDLFHASVQNLTASHYSQEQRDAWAPADHDVKAWGERIRHNRPFIAESDGVIAGFADLQPDGYIDHFFVSSECARRGVAAALMVHIHEAANARGIPQLYSNVSLTAEGFFQKCGFRVAERQLVDVRGQRLANARMEKSLAAAPRQPDPSPAAIPAP